MKEIVTLRRAADLLQKCFILMTESVLNLFFLHGNKHSDRILMFMCQIIFSQIIS